MLTALLHQVFILPTKNLVKPDNQNHPVMEVKSRPSNDLEVVQEVDKHRPQPLSNRVTMTKSLSNSGQQPLLAPDLRLQDHALRNRHHEPGHLDLKLLNQDQLRLEERRGHDSRKSLRDKKKRPIKNGTASRRVDD